MQRRLLAIAEWVERRASSKHNPFPVGTPDAVGLHESGIVGTGQRLPLAGFTVVPLKDSPSGIEDLQEAIVLEIGDVVGSRDIEGWRGKRAYYVAAMWRNLRHETYSRQTWLAVFIPLDYILVLDGDVARNGNERVESFVVRGTVNIDAHGFAVERKRMTVGARGHIGEQSPAFRLLNIAQPPFDEMNRRRRERLDSAVGALRRHQGDVAVENRGSDWIGRSRKGDASLRNFSIRFVVAGDD